MVLQTYVPVYESVQHALAVSQRAKQANSWHSMSCIGQVLYVLSLQHNERPTTAEGGT